MEFNLQPILENGKVILYPLQEDDFEGLYLAASDPKVWEQHPNKNHYQKEVFKTFSMQASKKVKVLLKL